MQIEDEPDINIEFRERMGKYLEGLKLYFYCPPPGTTVQDLIKIDKEIKYISAIVFKRTLTQEEAA